VAAPGVVVGLIPWMLTHWEPAELPMWAWPLRLGGAALVLGASAVLAREFVRFAVEGGGSPAPPVPTERLVVTGPYRHVRNPMYLAVMGGVLGQAALLARPVLLVYTAAVGGVMWLFVHGYEEPALRRQFGAEYDAYCAAVPGWWPRLRPAATDPKD
jgi:protein-S-isoprenylcysteine O-methyltransferase Ste14